MKHKIAFFLLAGCLLGSVGLNAYQHVQSKTITEKVSRYEEEFSPMYEYFSSLRVEDFKVKVASGADFVVYIGRPDCGDCAAFEPRFLEIIEEHNLSGKLEYVNVKWLRELGKEHVEDFKQEYNFTQTPAFIRFKDGKNISMLEWDTQKGLPNQKLIDWLTENQIIK